MLCKNPEWEKKKEPGSRSDDLLFFRSTMSHRGLCGHKRPRKGGADKKEKRQVARIAAHDAALAAQQIPRGTTNILDTNINLVKSWRSRGRGGEWEEKENAERSRPRGVGTSLSSGIEVIT